MAVSLSELFVTLSARTGAFDSAIASAHAKMGSLSAQAGRARDANGRFLAGMGGGAAAVTRAGGSFGAFSAGLSGIGKGLGAATVALGTFAGNVASRVAAAAAPLAGNVLGGASLDMEKRIAALAKALPETGPGIDEMRGRLFALSTTIKGVALNDLLDIAIAGAKMGESGEGLLTFTEGIARASTAVDDMSAAELTDQVGGVNAVFKLGADGAFRLSSAFDRLADSGISSFSGIANVVSRISGAAVASKITAAESAALAASLLDTKSNAELGATALTRLIKSLTDTEAHATFGKVLGISAEEFAARVEASPIQAIQEFLAALNRLDAGSQDVVLGGIGIEGIQGAGEIQKLAAQHLTLAKYIGFANSEMATADQITKSYNATAALTSSQLTQDQNRFQIMAVTVGDQLLPVIGAASEIFGAFATSIGEAFAGQGATVAGFRDGFIEVATAVGSAIGGLMSWFQEWPATAAIAYLKVMQGITNVGETFVFLKDTAVAAFTFIGDFAVNLFDRTMASIRNLFNGLGTVMENILSFNVGDVLKGDVDILKGFTPERTQALLPEFKAPTLNLSENQVIGELEAEQAARRAGAALARGLTDEMTRTAELVGPPRPAVLAPEAGAANAPGTGTFAADEKAKGAADVFRSESSGLADFATRFRQAQFTGRDAAAEARKEAELNRLALKENTKALQQQIKGFGLA